MGIYFTVDNYPLKTESKKKKNLKANWVNYQCAFCTSLSIWMEVGTPYTFQYVSELLVFIVLTSSTQK